MNKETLKILKHIGVFYITNATAVFLVIMSLFILHNEIIIALNSMMYEALPASVLVIIYSLLIISAMLWFGLISLIYAPIAMILSAVPYAIALLVVNILRLESIIVYSVFGALAALPLIILSADKLELITAFLLIGLICGTICGILEKRIKIAPKDEIQGEQL